MAANKTVLGALVGASIFLGLVAVWPRSVHPPAVNQNLSCPPRTMAEKIAGADLVVTGDVFAVLPFASQAEVLIVGERDYRGTVPDRGINIITDRQAVGDSAMTENGSGLNLRADSGPYLLLLNRRDDGRFRIDRCSGSRRLDTGLTAVEEAALGPGQAVDGGSIRGIH
jgi:hypothetical protein